MSDVTSVRISGVEPSVVSAPRSGRESDQKCFPRGMCGLDVLNALARQVFPRPLHCASHTGFYLGRPGWLFIDVVFECFFIAPHNFLKYPGRRNAWQIRPSGCRGQGQSLPDQVMRRIAYNGLIKIANVYVDSSFQIARWPKVSRMTVAANPYGRPVWKRPS